MTAVAPGAPGLPVEEIRRRAALGAAAVYPTIEDYGTSVHGAVAMPATLDPLDTARLVPPLFMPGRLEKLIDLGREPLFEDVDLTTTIGGLSSTLPVYLSAFGSTALGSSGLAMATAEQAGRLGIPMVIGENVTPVNGYRPDDAVLVGLLARMNVYASASGPDAGGVVVQQSTEDADAEVWNRVYSDPAGQPLLDAGRLAFELKLGQGAKPGLGGITVIDPAAAASIADRFHIGDEPTGNGRRLRHATPGSFTEEILRQQIRFMRNNFPRVRVWVKMHPGRDVAAAAAVAWAEGADAVTVDGAEGGTGWAPSVFLDRVGLPLGECLRRIGRPAGCLLASGRMWEGGRAVTTLALGAAAVGLGRAALLAVAEDRSRGLQQLVEALALEMRLLISALGHYSASALRPEDVLLSDVPAAAPTPVDAPVT